MVTTTFFPDFYISPFTTEVVITNVTLKIQLSTRTSARKKRGYKDCVFSDPTWGVQQNEKRTLAGVPVYDSSTDVSTVVLDQPLGHRHISISQTFAGKTVETRGEVGLLSRNIKIQGSQNDAFKFAIEACPRKFDSGQFATQSCFNGKFGEETGSDEFGANLLVHSKNKDLQEAEAKLEYVEFFWVGQAFRVGRYPIHFHLMGNVTGRNDIQGLTLTLSLF